MTRFLKRFVFALLTLGLGALAYALLRAEGERSLRPARARGTGGEPPSDRDASGGAAAAPEASPSGPQATAEPRRCAGLTQSGKRCSRPAEPGSDYCWQHAP
jgi:hypothetical protein